MAQITPPVLAAPIGRISISRSGRQRNAVSVEPGEPRVELLTGEVPRGRFGDLVGEPVERGQTRFDRVESSKSFGVSTLRCTIEK